MSKVLTHQVVQIVPAGLNWRGPRVVAGLGRLPAGEGSIVDILLYVVAGKSEAEGLCHLGEYCFGPGGDEGRVLQS